MDNYCSPQWVDFTSIPDTPSDDYFEMNHEIYKYNECFQENPKIRIVSEDKANIKEISETKIRNENTPIKVIYSPSLLRNKKNCDLTKKITYDDIVHEAIETVEHCIPVKLDIFKKPMQSKHDISKSLKCDTVDNNQVNVSSNMLPISDNPVICPTENSMKPLSLNIPSNQEENISIEKSNSNKQSKPITYNCRRQSVIFRRRSNQFVSLAAAVHKFQNETPERFHTKCNKNLKVKTTSAKKHSSVTRKSMFATSNIKNIKRRSVPVFNLKDEKDSKPDEVKEFPCDKISQKHLTETPNTTKTRSRSSFSSKHSARIKNVVSAIVDSNSSEIILKKEKVLFFDIPIHTKQKLTTRPVPFSFEYRDKIKKQSKSKQLQPEDNKSVNNVKSQNIPKKIGTVSIEMQNKLPPSINGKTNHSNQLGNNSYNRNKNDEKNISNTNKNPETTIKTNKSNNISSLKIYEKTKNKNKKSEHPLSKDAGQIKKQFMSICSKNSLDGSKDINKSKNTEHNTQAKGTNQVKKQSLPLLCKEKSKGENKKTETIKTKEDFNKIKKECSTHSNINTNTGTQENKCPNVDAFKIDTNLHIKNIKPKGPIIGMNSYERGKQRHEYDEKIKQKLQIQEEMRQKLEAEKLAHEKLQIAMFRKQLEVKAKPMPLYKPLVPLKSTKPLTEPQSPAWAFKNKTKKST